MRISTLARLIVSLCVGITVSATAQTTPNSGTFIDPRDTLRLQLEEERRRLIDPTTGDVPYDRTVQAREAILKNQKAGGGTTNAGIPGMVWNERGPSNFADVRSVLLDPNDPTKKKVWVGTANGSIWYTNDIANATPAWVPAAENLAGQVISLLAADPSNSQVMYAGTGDSEYAFSTGIWKTTDGGATWNRLSSTTPTGSYPSSVSRAFEYIQRVVVNASGHVFVATRYGVARSADGGATWQMLLAPNQGIGFGTSNGNSYSDFVSDLEIAADGVVYASLRTSRVFKSTNATATTWAEVTPVGVTGERTELAVAQSTSGTGQVLYALSRAYTNTNYSQDIRWFKKSTDAGATWADVTIPMLNSSDHFTQGNGYRYVNLSVSPTDANMVFAGGAGLFRSLDGGSTWTHLLEASTNSFLSSQAGLQVVAGTSGVLNVARQRVYWLADGANVGVTAPTATNRTTDVYTGHER
jgi:trimeric autotransporter adhesin